MKFITKTAALLIPAALCCAGLAQACELETNEQYIVNNDGTITDNINGLMWTSCNLGQTWNGNQCVGDITPYDWSEALTVSETATVADHSDWYLPNVKELFSLSQLDCAFPAIDETLFPNTGYAAYWSSSHNNNDATQAWTIEFYRGEPVLYEKSRSNFVRLVRKVAP